VALPIKLGIVTEYPLLVECDAAIAFEIGANARTLRDRMMQSRQARNLSESSPHPSRKRIDQAFDDLEQRQVSISQGAADELARALGIARQNALEPS
jgi:hypothetical protein